MRVKKLAAACAIVLCFGAKTGNAIECEDTIVISGPPIGCVGYVGAIKEIDISSCNFVNRPKVSLDARATPDRDSIDVSVASVTSKTLKIIVTVNGSGGHSICNPSSVTWRAHD